MKKIFFTMIILVSITFQIKSGTNIKVGNYTNQTVKMTYKQIGKNKLKKGKHFKVKTTKIERNQEKDVFEVNRNVGIKKNKEYYFEFKFPPKDKMSFVVSLKGQWTGSIMKQKIQSTHSATKWRSSKGLQSLEIITKDGKRIRFDVNRWLKFGDTYDNLEFFLYEY